MRNFKNGRRRNSLSVYLFKIQCFCATIKPTGLQVHSFIHRIFNNVTNRHLSRRYCRRMKQVANVNRSARNVSFDDLSIHHVLFDAFGGNLYGMQ